MTSSVGVRIGAATSGDPAELTGSRTRVLRLSGQRIAPRWDGVCAIVEADAAEIDGVCGFLERAFGADAVPGTEEDYVTHVLAPCDRGGVSVALAAWWDRNVVVGICSGSHAYLCGQDGCVDIGVEARGTSIKNVVRVDRVTPSMGDSLVLVSAAVAQHVTKRELEDTVSEDFSSGFSAHDAARWLATLATARGGGDASAMVLRFRERHTAGQLAAGSVAAPRRAALSRSIGKATAVLLLCTLVLGAVFLLWRPFNASSGASLAGARPSPPAIPAKSYSSHRTEELRPVLPTPRPVRWTFPALSRSVGRSMLALYNPRAVAMITDVRILRAGGDDVRRVRVPAKGIAKLQLSATETEDVRGKAPALTVQVAAPIVPARVVVPVAPTATPATSPEPSPTATPRPTLTLTATPRPTLTPTATARPTAAIHQARAPTVAPKPTGAVGSAQLSLALRSVVAGATRASTRISRCQTYLARLGSGNDPFGSVAILGCIKHATHRLQDVMKHLGIMAHQLPPSVVEGSVGSASRTAVQAQAELQLAARDIQSASLGDAQSALIAAAKDMRAAWTALVQAQHGLGRT